MKEVLKKNIKVLTIDKKVVDKLEEQEVNYVHELCLLNRKKLKEFGLKSSEINDIIVKLQLQGLDLGKRYKVK